MPFLAPEVMEAVGKIPEEEKRKIEDVDIDKEEIGILFNFRIKDVSVEPQPVKEEMCKVSCTIQHKTAFPWDDWGPPPEPTGCRLMVKSSSAPEFAEVERKVTSPQSSELWFNWTPQMSGIWELKLDLTAEDASETISVTVQELGPSDIETKTVCENHDYYWYNDSCHSEQQNGGNGGPPSFLECLKNMDTAALWKYHKGETVALGLGMGGLVLLTR